MDPLYLVIGAIVIFVLYRKGLLTGLFNKTKDATIPSTTGHPVLDLMVEAAAERYKDQPRVVDIVNTFAASIVRPPSPPPAAPKG